MVFPSGVARFAECGALAERLPPLLAEQALLGDDYRDRVEAVRRVVMDIAPRCRSHQIRVMMAKLDDRRFLPAQFKFLFQRRSVDEGGVPAWRESARSNAWQGIFWIPALRRLLGLTAARIWHFETFELYEREFRDAFGE
jgi:hypothetical protein